MGNSISDSCLVTRLQRGDPQAFELLVRRWEDRMLAVAFRITGQIADAEEVRQSILLRIVENPERLPQPSRFATWIRRCVVNESISLIRRRKKETRRHDSTITDLPDGSSAPESNVVRDDEAEQLRAILATLPDEQRAILSLRFDDGLTIREIAEVLRKPHTTIHAQLQLAIKSLRIALTVQPGIGKR